MKPYIIAETAYNHEGDFDYLVRMTKEIGDIGLQAVKYHLLLDASSYMVKTHPLFETIGNWMFSKEQWIEIFHIAQEYNLDIVALCDDVESLEFINATFPEISAVELHATSINDYYLLKEAAKFPGKVILGTGGSTLDEISYAIDSLKKEGKEDILLMYGFQSYPTDYNLINLARIEKIRELFDLPVGYADHTGYDDPNNEIISIMAAMIGVEVLEKHYTLDYGVERVDYHAAVGYEKMQKIVNLLNLALTVYGTDRHYLSETEKNYAKTGSMKKAIVARRPIAKGERLSIEKLWFKRTVQDTYIRQLLFPEIISCVAKRDLEIDEIIDCSNIACSHSTSSLSDFTHKRQDE